MGLDACVYCDCVEKGRLRVPHPDPHLFKIAEDGMPYLEAPFGTPEDERHESWLRGSPCGHEDFTLIHRRLGNIAMIAWVRACVARIAKDPVRTFPILWTKVVYSGTHASDHLDLADVRWLKEEIASIRATDWAAVPLERLDMRLGSRVRRLLLRDGTSAARDAERDMFLAFFANLEELVAASLEIAKPIVF